jgi:hypothetical protein
VRISALPFNPTRLDALRLAQAPLPPLLVPVVEGCTVRIADRPYRLKNPAAARFLKSLIDAGEGKPVPSKELELKLGLKGKNFSKLYHSLPEEVREFFGSASGNSGGFFFKGAIPAHRVPSSPENGL